MHKPLSLATREEVVREGSCTASSRGIAPGDVRPSLAIRIMRAVSAYFLADGVLVMYFVHALTIALWAFVTETGISHTPYLPSPTKVLGALMGFLYPSTGYSVSKTLFLHHSFFGHVLLSMERVYAGLLLGSIAGIVVGVLAGKSKHLGRLFRSYINFFASTPRVVFLGIFVISGSVTIGQLVIGPLLDGSGAIALSAIVAFYCAGNATYEITRDGQYKVYVEQALLDITKTQAFFVIVLPIAKMPMIASMRIAIAATGSAVFYAEWMISSSGIGQLLNTMVLNTRIPEFFTLVIFTYAIMLPGLVILPLIGHALSIPTYIVAWFVARAQKKKHSHTRYSHWSA
jgi:ABC-type nitrate/sulfonate/bicarbonate transport system permease component